jgi:hypothetical protein
MSDAVTTDVQPETEPAEPVEVDKDWKTIAEQTEKRAKRFEDQAKANAAAAKELEQLKVASMSELEKAVALARAEGLAEGQKAASARLAVAEIKAALAARPVDVEAILEGIDPSRFLGDDGEPDVKAIRTWADRIAPEPEPQPQGYVPNLAQGTRGSGRNVALNSDELLRKVTEYARNK